MLESNLTQIEAEKWEEIRRKLYFPSGADEYRSSSKPLTDFTLTFLMEMLPCSKRPLKEGYIADICRDGNVAPCALILGLIYIQRLARVNPAYLARSIPAEVFLTSMVIASKYLQDEGECEALVNSEWASVGQKDKQLLDKLEMEFLDAINWNLYVPNSEFNLFTSYIQGRIAGIEASKRGWWSYTDMTSYWDSTHTLATMKNATTQTTKTVSGSLATYFLCVTAIVSASNVAMETSTSPASLIDTDYRPACSLLNTTDGFTQAPPHYKDHCHTHPPDDLYYAIINNTRQWDTINNYRHGNNINNNRRDDNLDNHSDIHEGVWIKKDKGQYKPMADTVKYKDSCNPTTVSSNMTMDQLNDTGGGIGLLDRIVHRLATGRGGVTTCWCNFIFGT